MTWRPMTEHVFPWPDREVIVVAFLKDEPETIDCFRCNSGEHGALFPKDRAFMSLIEDGWIPFAWRVDDIPSRDDKAWPPMWTDYLTEDNPHG